MLAIGVTDEDGTDGLHDSLSGWGLSPPCKHHGSRGWGSLSTRNGKIFVLTFVPGHRPQGGCVFNQMCCVRMVFSNSGNGGC